MEKVNRLYDSLYRELQTLKRIEQTLYNNKGDINYDDTDYKIIKFQMKSLERILK